MPEPALKTANLSEQIKDLLVQRLANGLLGPGDRLVELTLAREMGTSQAPVREALRLMEGLGLIEFRRNRGAVVREISEAERIQIYAVRAELEGFAAETVASRNPDVGADLLALCDRMDASAERGGDAFAALNTRFHWTIVDGADNRTLTRLWDALDIQTRTLLNTARSDDHLDAARRDHRQIAQAIADGDAPAARSRLVAHINAVAR